MQLKKKPVTGMKDILPREMEIRDYLIGLIKETYKQFGFTSMETPCVEHIENLTSKQGGDNEKLIFRILKRGEKLKISEAKSMIRSGQMNFTQISEYLGYSSIHYFSRQFKRSTGMTPSEYVSSIRALADEGHKKA